MRFPRAPGLPLLIVFCLCACTAHEPYPAKWEAPVAPKQDCGHITGEYGNTGGTGSPFASPTLTSLLLETGGERATRVSLSLRRADMVELVAYEKSVPSLSAILDDVACQRGTLTVRRALWEAEGVAAGPQDVVIELSTSGEWLIVRVVGGAPGAALGYAPPAGWHRFRRL